MYSYIIGLVTEINDYFITLECDKIGFLIKISNPNKFILNKIYKVYIYQLVKENSLELFGFLSLQEKNLFVKLLNVKGIGPKSILNILKADEIENIINNINLGNTDYFSKISGIGPKTSENIIKELSSTNKINKPTTIHHKIYTSLLSLGFTKDEINNVLKDYDLNQNLKLDIIIKDLLRKLQR